MCEYEGQTWSEQLLPVPQTHTQINFIKNKINYEMGTVHLSIILRTTNMLAISRL